MKLPVAPILFNSCTIGTRDPPPYLNSPTPKSRLVILAGSSNAIFDHEFALLLTSGGKKFFIPFIIDAEIILIGLSNNDAKPLDSCVASLLSG